MKKLSNISLMLKQGIKGVFKFKVQFIIIVVLAFISTLILSASLSTQKRIDDSYNRIVKPVDEFSYSGNLKVGTTSDTPDQPFLLSNLVSATDANSLEVLDADGNTIRHEEGFNFVLNNFDNNYATENGIAAYGMPSFITQATDAFIEISDKNSTFFHDYHDLSNPRTGAVELYGDLLQKYLFYDLEQISKLAGSKDKSLSDLDNKLKYSPLGVYTYKNPFWFSSYVKDIPNDISDDPVSAANANKVLKISFAEPNKYSHDINLTTVYSARSAAASIAGFTNVAVEKAGLSSEKTGTAIEFLFGQKVDGFDADNSQNWLVSKDDNKYGLNIKSKEGESVASLPIINDNSGNDAVDLISKFGLRGITNPIVDNDNSDLKHNSLKIWNDYCHMDLNNTSEYLAFYSWIDNGETFYNTYADYAGVASDTDKGNILDPVGFSWDPAGFFGSGWTGEHYRKISSNVLFRTYNMVASEAADFKFGIRRETDLVDSQSGLNYRAIVLNDNENYNVTYLSGKAPSSSFQVAISQEFATKNHLKAGMPMKILNGYVWISGIVADAFSYMPSQDINNPIPNNKKSGYIFASEYTIGSLYGIAYDKGRDDATQMLSYFVWNKNGSKNNDNVNLLYAFSSNDTSKAINNQKAIASYVDGRKTAPNTRTYLNYVPFSESPYRYSWETLPFVMQAYGAVVYKMAAVIGVIAIIAIAAGVKKTVDYNSKQIGILKALGASPRTISISYLSYSLVITFIAVPVAWMIGLIFQIPFAHMFVNWFTMMPNSYTWDWLSFVVAFFGLGVLSGIIAFSSAYILTKRPILKILNSSVKWGHLSLLDWMKSHVFKKSKFSVRFSITLGSSGSRQIILMSAVMLIASFFTTISLSIPAVTSKVNELYYRAVKYANKYEEIPMVGNAPLSKNAISYWNGQKYADSQYVDAKLKLDDTKSRYGYYKNISAYDSTVSGASALPEYLYNSETGKFESSYTYLLSHMDDLLNNLSFIFGNNFYNNTGVAFSIGMIDELYGIILHSYENTYGEGGNVNVAPKTDEEKINDSRSISRVLTTSIPNILKMILNNSSAMTNAGDAAADANWKTTVLTALNEQLPSFVKGYLQSSESRQDQYGIGYQNEIYVPGEETLLTEIKNDNLKVNGVNQSVVLSGLDKNQHSIMIDENDKSKLYLNSQTKKKILDVLTGLKTDEDISTGELGQIYNHVNKTLTLPMILNKQAESSFGLKKNSLITDWSNNLQSLQLRINNGTFVDLPRNAWVYDDTDYAKYLAENTDNKLRTNVLPYAEDSLAYNPNDPNGDWLYDTAMSSDSTAFDSSSDKQIVKHYYLDPANLDNGKMTYTTEFKDNELSDKAMLFKNFTYDKNLRPNGTYLRPYYQYRNIKLFVPEGWIDSPENFLWNDGTKHTQDKDKTEGWFNEVSTDEVPDSVKNSYERLTYNSKLKWEDAKNNKWLIVNPYDLNYSKTSFANQGKTPITNLTDAPGYWYRWILSGPVQELRINISDNSNNYLKSLGAPDGLKINFKSIGSINSYNDKLIVIDSDIANWLYGYSTSRAYQYNYQIFDKKTLIPGTVDSAPKEPKKKHIFMKDEAGTSRFDRYKLLDVNDEKINPNFMLNKWKDHQDEKADVWQPAYYSVDGNVLDYAPHNFFNAKLSNIDEPLNLTSAVSETLPVRVGQYAVGLGHSVLMWNTTSISSQTLLSTTRALTNQIASLAISIAVILVVAIVVTAALLTMLTGDIYIAQYKRFMVLLRALGYSNSKVISYTFGTVTVFSLLMWVLGIFVAWFAISGVTNILWTAGFAIPLVIDWWPIVVSFILLGVAYVLSLWVSSYKARHSNPSEILTATAE